jgi:hypothetical protein
MNFSNSWSIGNDFLLNDSAIFRHKRKAMDLGSREIAPQENPSAFREVP